MRDIGSTPYIVAAMSRLHTIIDDQGHGVPAIVQQLHARVTAATMPVRQLIYASVKHTFRHGATW